MTDNNNRKGMDPMVAGAIAVAGAAVGAAATMYLTKEENRTSIPDKAFEMKGKAEKTIDNWKNKGEDAAEDVKQKAKKGSFNI